MSITTDPDTGLTEAVARQFARIALGHVTREYPNKLDHVLTGPADAQGPRALHPVFYGSFDWHSCVHGYWMLARLRRRFPACPEAAAIADLFDEHLTPGKVAVERAYLDRPSSRGFERPYGWVWLLMLAAELSHHADPAGARWQAALTPLADAFAARLLAWLPRADYPVRAGTHANGAFALTLALEYAAASGRGDVAAAARAAARRWFAADRDAQAWEPGGDDFLSATLIEAECMRRALPAAEFPAWFDGFLPRIAARQPDALFTPAAVSDRSDGKIAHLDGTNLSRAWCWRSLAASLPAGDARAAVMRAAARTHIAASLPHVAGDYMGEHWLATYAVLALEA